ncbi:hypothetical protein [Deinococcus sp. JMULE3]|uniref:hypothetical protein n=1 Tax=Deinococcus sp. JMULE3 TaxID=2518341 RepID=UPI0015759FC0|nr:hypothetical protein [Deinococcus sp. JMULE3]NTX99297.1 hypothetical protein [Deinococcus sp. JMULE3]
MSEVPPRNALNLWKSGAVALALEGVDGQARMLGANNPLPVAFPPGATSDPDSAREATQQEILAQVLLAVSALQVMSGNTDGLEVFAQQSNTLLTQLTSYNDGVETLLGSLNSNTDGIETLLGSLGLKDDNVLSKLTEILAKDEQIRVLLAAQAAKTEAQPVSAASLPLPAGAATSALQTSANTILTALQTAVGLLGTEATQVAIRNALQGTLQVKLNPDIPAIIVLNIPTNGTASDPILLNTQTVTMIDVSLNWSAADLSLEHSTDGGATWLPVYDRFGNALTFKVTANRAITLEPNDLWRKGRVRFRSGVPGAYVAQAAATTLTLTVVTG